MTITYRILIVDVGASSGQFADELHIGTLGGHHKQTGPIDLEDVRKDEVSEGVSSTTSLVGTRKK